MSDKEPASGLIILHDDIANLRLLDMRACFCRKRLGSLEILLLRDRTKFRLLYNMFFVVFRELALGESFPADGGRSLSGRRPTPR